MNRNKNITILGSTGSIGQSALEVVRHVEGLNVFAISGRSNLSKLVEQALEFKPRYLVAADESMAENFTFPDLGETEVLVGEAQLDFIASLPEVDIVLAAIVGVAGLPSAWAAVESGKTVALANKEALVVAGHLMTDSANRSGATILPVDSEHSAVFQALKAGSPEEINRIVLTASGGPFRDWDVNLMESVTVEQALAHPTWDMGQKISIDSATMMNKIMKLN